jgi:multimeric flavodoxin WrbA
MFPKNIVALDGAGPHDDDLSPTFETLSRVLTATGAQVRTFCLRGMKLAHCLGCFKCFIQTPGICVESDVGREIAKAVIQSDLAVLFTPVTFGGYSPELKKMLDHFIQLISPFFRMDHGEVHHPPRYAHRPRLIVVGVQRHPNPREAHIFKTLAGRNAINLLPPSYAVEVVLTTDDPKVVRYRFQALLTRSDSFPFGDAAASLMPPPAVLGKPQPPAQRRALLVVGSPKTSEPSTSSALGGFLLKRLERYDWETESLTLRASLDRPQGEAELRSAVERAELILLAFPLYADALPYLVTRALATMAAHRPPDYKPFSQRLVAAVNSGFPETHQNAVALAICREFATQYAFSWAGSLAFAAGGLIGGHPFTDAKRPGPPVPNVIAALEMAATTLAAGLPVPAEAMKMITRHHIPLGLWNRLYMYMGGRGFQKQAAQNGINKEQLLAQPYAA